MALEFVPTERPRNRDARRRFEHEARAASAVDHPLICIIHDGNRTERYFEYPEGRLFIVTAYGEEETVNKVGALRYAGAGS